MFGGYMSKKVYILIVLIFYSFNNTAADQTAKIKIFDKKDHMIVREVPSSTEELYFNDSFINKIEGLEELFYLKTLILDRTVNLNNDLTWISKLENIETLIIIGMKIEDTSPLVILRNLTTVIFNSVEIDGAIDELKLPNHLEYLEISNSKLTKIPNFYFDDVLINQVNLSHNEITFESVTQKDIDILSRSEAVILTGNPILKDIIWGVFNNLKIYNDPQNILNRNYRKMYNFSTDAS